MQRFQVAVWYIMVGYITDQCIVSIIVSDQGSSNCKMVESTHVSLPALVEK